MKRTPDVIEDMVERLFKFCTFGPEYMSEEEFKEHFRQVIKDMDEEEWKGLCYSAVLRGE